MKEEYRAPEISIFDLSKTLVGRWKSILCAAIILMLVVGLGLSARRSGGEDISEPVDMDTLMEEYETELELYEKNYLRYQKFSEIADAAFDAWDKTSDAFKNKLSEMEGLDPADEKWMEEAEELGKIEELLSSSYSLYTGLGSAKKPSEPVDPSDETAEDTDENGGLSPKFFIAGFLLGAALMCAVWTAVYTMDGKVKLPSDIAKWPGVRIVGRPDREGLAAVNIVNAMPDDAAVLLITGSSPDETEIMRLSQAIKTLEPGFEIWEAAGLSGDIEAAKLLSAADAVVLVEKLKASKLSDIAEEIDMVEGAGKTLLGVCI